MHYTGLYRNTFVMKLDGSNDSTIDGEPYVKEIDVSVGSPFVNMPWKGTKAEITFDGGSITLDFA